MTLTDAYEIAGAVLVSLGGAAAILFAFSSWLGKVWAERILSKEKAKYAEDLEAFKKQLVLETESHKVRLKKSELIFAREFDAASALVALVRDISPRYRYPTMDWHDACDDIAQEFGKIESQIGAYLRSHGAVLSQSVRDLLSSCMANAGENKFEVFDGEVSAEANSAADKLYTKLQEAEAALLAQVNSQVTR
ncbi:MAG: hypothetical protein NTX70_00810 [Verrucomicrobia bacterium]|nr:hypothetical protein [Verrucomicrobiota bacterium]